MTTANEVPKLTPLGRELPVNLAIVLKALFDSGWSWRKDDTFGTEEDAKTVRLHHCLGSCCDKGPFLHISDMVGDTLVYTTIG